MVTEPHFRSCLALRSEFDTRGIDHSWLTGSNESLTTRARNEMTATYLRETEYEYMMWLDADIEFDPEDVNKLAVLDADIAVGVYPMKKPDVCWYAAWVNGELIKDLDQFDKPIAVDFAGTGFMLLKRSAVEKLWKAAPKYEGPNGEVAAIYQTPVVENHFDSEDYHLCRTWRAMGGEIIMDPSVKLLHHGTYAYGR